MTYGYARKKENEGRKNKRKGRIIGGKEMKKNI